MPIDILSDPNVAYVLLVGGTLMAILGLFSPGTGFVELGALFAIVLAGISISNLPINTWALALLILGVIPFLLALRFSRKYIYLAVSIITLIVGSIFLIDPQEGILAIDPFLAVFVSVISIGFMWLVGTKGVEAIQLKPTHDMKRLADMLGVAETEIFREGTVYVAGESWSATSTQWIPEGARVRIIGREGLQLMVEQAGKEEQPVNQVI